MVIFCFMPWVGLDIHLGEFEGQAFEDGDLRGLATGYRPDGFDCAAAGAASGSGGVIESAEFGMCFADALTFGQELAVNDAVRLAYQEPALAVLVNRQVAGPDGALEYGASMGRDGGAWLGCFRRQVVAGELEPGGGFGGTSFRFHSSLCKHNARPNTKLIRRRMKGGHCAETGKSCVVILFQAGY